MSGQKERPDLGLNLYSVRDRFAERPDDTLERLAQAGFKNVEWFGGLWGRSAERWRSTLDRLRLRARVAHVDLESLLAEDLTPVFDAYETLGADALIAPFITPEQREDDQVFERVGAGLDQAGYQARTRGFRIGYHNHDFEFTLANQRGQALDGVDQIMTRCSSGNVSIELDVFWVAWAGLDPVEVIERIGRTPDRLMWLHIKDGKLPDGRKQCGQSEGFTLPYEEIPFTPLGEGDLDLEAIVRAGLDAQVRALLIEQDFCGKDPDGHDFLGGDTIEIAAHNLRKLEELAS